MKFVFVLPAMFIAAMAMTAQADVTYVDATAANTTLADGSAFSFGNGTDADDLWNNRGFGNDGGVITSNDNGNSEDAPRLRTTMSGLVAGQTHDVYAYFWGAGSNQNWRGRASLTDDAGALPGYNTNHFTASSFSPMTYVTSESNDGSINPGPLSTADANGVENGGYFSNSVLTEEQDRRLYSVFLGSVAADGTGNINVFIDDLENTSGANRTWYDGVGFEAVPEPGSGLVLLITGLAAISTRRRKR
ncbi:MAG: PEP-CTERM sorting domain-containing protein [Mariniblastus sp.]